jgi:hypothetical protein
MIEGIDISHWQATTPDLTGRAFVFARATYGTSPDGRYAMHAANVRAAGRVLGAYHFARPITTGDSVAEQVAAFLAAGSGADLFALDRERDGDNGTMTQADARAFIAAVQATGRRIGLYASESAFADLGQDWDWVANWSREPARHWDFWQYRGSPLDLDRFAGTLADLRALGQETTMTYPVPKVPSLGDVAAGVRLYAALSLVPDSDPATGDIIIDPARSMPYLGQPSAAAKVVEYVNAAGVHSGKAYFVKTAEVTNIRAVPDMTPFDQADIDAVAGPLRSALAAANASVVALTVQRDAARADLGRAQATVAALTKTNATLVIERDAARAATAAAIVQRDSAQVKLQTAQTNLAVAEREMYSAASALNDLDAFRARH